jgi:MFS transporter, UMF1 family
MSSMSETSKPSILINDPKTMNGWAYFDCANSAHSLVIATAVFPPFFEAVAPEKINILGQTITSSAMLAFAITLSYGIMAFLSPPLSGIADYGGKRKFFMRIFTYLGALSCIAMFFMEKPEEWLIGWSMYVLAMIGYAGGVVFNNSYLPLIATPDKYDALSARGFMYGYIGATLLLILNLMMILNYDKLGFPDKGIPTRLAFIMVGIWWLIFANITFKRMPADDNTPLGKNAFWKGFSEIKKVWKTISTNKDLKRYLTAFFFFDAGVQTTIFLATIFATKVLGFKTENLIVVVLVIQILGALGAWFFAKVSEKYGNKTALIILLACWVVICLAAYFIENQTPFYALAAAVGSVMGGIQSLARSTYAKLMPIGTKDTTSFYSFYDLTDKLAVVMGTFVFGSIDQFIGLRYSVVAMAFLFLIGFLILIGVDLKEKKEVSNCE